MKKKYLKFSVFSFFLFVCLLLYFTNRSYSQSKNKYMGADKCAKVCHKGKKKGSQLEIWKSKKHSQAYHTLGTEAAKKLGKELNLKEEPQKSKECLKCHVTGYGLDESNFTKDYKMEEGVSCESCHGPGSVYKKLSIMKDTKKFLANGGVLPDEKVCVKCHNEESPSYKEFVFDEKVKIIVHPKPEK